MWKTDYEIFSNIIKTEQTPSILYHYTNMSGLIGIISNKEIWMTNIKYCNDRKEYDYGRKYIISLLEKNKNVNSEENEICQRVKNIENKWRNIISVFSVSEEKDLLSQWRGYTNNGNGYSIGFDLSKYSDLTKHKDTGLIYFPIKCIYNEEEIIPIFKKVMKYLIERYRDNKIWNNSLIIRLFTILSIILKDKSFKEEKEWRLISISTIEKYSFRRGQQMIIPYLRINRKNIKIKEIIIGPVIDYELSLNSIKLLLISNSEKDCVIEKSKIPYQII